MRTGFSSEEYKPYAGELYNSGQVQWDEFDDMSMGPCVIVDNHRDHQELIELVLRLQRPEKTSRTSSKPPSTDRKERRERSRPGGAKPGHEGRSRPLSDEVSETVAH
jgi:hypothetical protein